MFVCEQRVPKSQHIREREFTSHQSGEPTKTVHLTLDAQGMLKDKDDTKEIMEEQGKLVRYSQLESRRDFFHHHGRPFCLRVK